MVQKTIGEPEDKKVESAKSLDEASENTEEEELWEKFLKPAKVIRDAVHGDVWLTDMETEIIKQLPFQRLRYIRQLGASHLVYPSANHTRFEHSIGVLHIAQKIIDSVERNFKYKERIIDQKSEHKLADNEWRLYGLENRDKVLIRLTALLHDAAHIPFGHTLEKVGKLFERTQWADKKRVEKIFDGVFSVVIDECLIKGGAEPVKAKKFITDLRNTLRAIEGVTPNSEKIEKNEDAAIRQLDYPYVGDIIGNTVCADLLDYVKRDSYFTGFRLAYDPRIIENFVIIGKFDGSEKRSVLLLIKKGKLRPDMITSVFTLLELRYQLAETVYYHRVNAYLSAILINSIYAAMEANIISYDDLLKLTDDALIYRMTDILNEHKETEEKEDDKGVLKKRCLINTAKNLLVKYKERRIYKPVYAVFSRESGTDAVKIKDIIEQYTAPKERLKFQHWLEDMVGLDEGSIIMYVTEKDKGKDALTKVLWIDGNIKSLKDIGEDETIKDFTSTLERRYSKLWRLYLFVDEEKVVDYGRLIAAYCKKLFPNNDIENEEYSQADVDDVELYIKCHHKDEQVSEAEKEQMRADISTRPSDSTMVMKPKQVYDEVWDVVKGEGS